MQNLRDKFSQKKILITGGTGSFGSTVLKYLLSTDIDEIRILSRDEKKQDDMRRQISDSRVKFFIGDVRDKSSLNFCIRGVHFIFHAAAFKQVPSCEFYPIEAVKTNIIGTENVLTMAAENNVDKVVCLSTDKAVYPINAMGMSKALMEKIMIAKSRMGLKTQFIGTRYGNVMASRGSVIPLFIEQIKRNLDLTVTDPKMTRFMMSLDNAIDLVLFAFNKGKSGDVFVQKAPAATIGTLAQALIEIFNSSSKIKIIGVRHGEKSFESLLSKEERIKAEDLGKYFRIPVDDRDLNYQLYFSKGTIAKQEIGDYNSSNTKILNIKELKEILLKVDDVKNALK